MATSTPWGSAQHSERYHRGITFYSTASHGGFKVCATLNAAIPEYMRIRDGWYEEDCDWAIVAVSFPQVVRDHYRDKPGEAEKMLSAAKDTLRNWRPGAYERFYGEIIPPGQSLIKDEMAWKAAHADDLVVETAWGDWAVGVPPKMVGVMARRGATRREGPDRYFLVPADEYHGRHFGFVIDPARHIETDPISGESKPAKGVDHAAAE